jgi:hypothetical protein
MGLAREFSHKLPENDFRRNQTCPSVAENMVVKPTAPSLLIAALLLTAAGLPADLGAAPLPRNALVLRDDPNSWGHRLDTLMQPPARAALPMPASAKAAESLESGKQPKSAVSAVTQAALVVPTDAAQETKAPPKPKPAAAPPRPVAQHQDDRSWMTRLQSWIMGVAGSMQ